MKVFCLQLKTRSLWTLLFFTNLINFVIHFRSKWWGAVYSLPSLSFIQSFISLSLSLCLFSSTVGIQPYISFRYMGSFILNSQEFPWGPSAFCTWREDKPPCESVRPGLLSARRSSRLGGPDPVSHSQRPTPSVFRLFRPLCCVFFCKWYRSRACEWCREVRFMLWFCTLSLTSKLVLVDDKTRTKANRDIIETKINH